MSTFFSINYNSTKSNARLGTLKLPHGELETPVFMPVGTQATVKAQELNALDDLGYSLILSNTYHLMLRPGIEVLQLHGSLHNFMRWKKNILTDSGGYQVFSLSPLRSIKDDGVRFRSHIDGSLYFLSPELAVDLQVGFGSDIQMVLDVCTEPGISEKKALSALITTTNWAKKALTHIRSHYVNGYKGKLFLIMQGNFFKNLRQRSAEELMELDAPGYAIGGLSVGETFEQYCEFLHFSAELLPKEKPRYVMGIGTPDYILEAVEAGVDMFDCVFPTRVARNGTFMTDEGKIVIKNEKYKNDINPIHPESPIAEYSRAYLRHLFKSEEILGTMLATRHNLWYMSKFMKELRRAIREDNFLSFKANFLSKYHSKN